MSHLFFFCTPRESVESMCSDAGSSPLQSSMLNAIAFTISFNIGIVQCCEERFELGWLGPNPFRNLLNPTHFILLAIIYIYNSKEILLI